MIGKCPQCYDPVPNDLDCPEHGAKISYPGSCTQYVKCMYVKKCTQKGRGPYWGHILVSCDEGEYFDDKKKRCTPGSCKRPPKDLEKGMECSVEGETKVHPNRCYEVLDKIYPDWKLFPLNSYTRFCLVLQMCLLESNTVLGLSPILLPPW